MTNVLGLTEEESIKFWDVWAKEWHFEDGEFEQSWFGYDVLEDETGIPIKTLKKVIKIFREKGLAFHGPTVDCNYSPNGSGLFLKFRMEEKSWDEIKLLLEGNDESNNT